MGSTTATSATTTVNGAVRARAYLKARRPAEALTIIEAWLADHPDDKTAQKVLLQAKVAAKEAELRQIIDQQTTDGSTPLLDPEYEELKDTLDEDRRRRIEIAEHFLLERRYSDAIDACNKILRDNPDDPATLKLKYRALDQATKRQREDFERDQDYRHAAGITDVVESNRYPKDKPVVQRQVFVFQEDIDESERQKVRARLQTEIELSSDKLEVRKAIMDLFKLGGLSYVILDDAIEDKKVTLFLGKVTIESALNALSKLVKIRFSYTDGTVFVTGDENEGLITEVIRLRSGLTNVSAPAQVGSFSGGGGGDGGGGSGGGGGIYTPGQNGGQGGFPGGFPGGPGGPGGPGFQPPGAQGGPGGGPGGNDGGDAGGNGTDLEKFLEQAPSLIAGWPERGKLYLDRKSNTLYAHATPYAIQELKRLLQALDYNNTQVLIEARFIEVGEETLNRLGFNWGARQNSGNQIGATPLSVGKIGSNTSDSLTTDVTRGALDGTGFQVKLQALEQERKIDTLAEPKILTLNNATGLIKLTNDIWYISGYTNQGTGYYPGNNQNNLNTNVFSQVALVPQFSRAQGEISLKITPSMARNSDVITLKLLPTVREIRKDPSEVEFTSGTGSDGKPITNKISRPPEFAERSLSTVLHVKNGETIALGGLTTEKREDSVAGTPFLSKIPLLGFFFKNTGKSRERKNLVILVTATVIDPSGSKVGDEIAKLRDSAQIQIPAGPMPGGDGRPVETPAGPDATLQKIQPPPPAADLNAER